MSNLADLSHNWIIHIDDDDDDDRNDHSKKQVNILDILDTMVASNVEASVAANGIRDNVIACADDGGIRGCDGACDVDDNLIEENNGITVLQGRGESVNSQDRIIGKRTKRSENEFTACCNELHVSINVVEDDTVKDIHNEWVGRYFLQSGKSNTDLLVYKRQTARKRYLYIRR